MPGHLRYRWKMAHALQGHQENPQLKPPNRNTTPTPSAGNLPARGPGPSRKPLKANRTADPATPPIIINAPPVKAPSNPHAANRRDMRENDPA